MKFRLNLTKEEAMDIATEVAEEAQVVGSPIWCIMIVAAFTAAIVGYLAYGKFLVALLFYVLANMATFGGYTLLKMYLANREVAKYVK